MSFVRGNFWWSLLAAACLLGCTERHFKRHYAEYPFGAPAEHTISAQVGIEAFHDLRSEEDKEALGKIYDWREWERGGYLQEAPESLGQLLAARFAEDLRQSSLFQQIHFPQQPEDELTLRGKIHRLDTNMYSWPPLSSLQIFSLVGGFAPGGHVRTDMEVSLEVRSPLEEAPVLAFKERVSNEHSVNAWETLNYTEMEKNTATSLSQLASLLKTKLWENREQLTEKARAVRESRRPAPAPPVAIATPAGALRGVAIYPFTARGDVPVATAEALGGLFQKEIAGTPCARIVAEDIIEDLARQLGLEQACGTESCQIDLATQASADLLVRGELLKVGETYVLTALMIDLASKRTVFTGDVQAGDADLIPKTRELASRAGAALGCGN